MLKINQYFKSKIGALRIERFLGKGKSGHSYLARLNKRSYVLKVMHNEDCAFYSFSEPKVTLEIRSYEILEKLNIPVPKLKTFDIGNNYLIKEFIDGRVATELISAGKIKDSHIKHLFRMADRLKSKNLNIDYFPNNFVISSGQLYYVDYELNVYSAEWNLENWGLYYWANVEGMKRYLEQGDILAINLERGKGIPVKEPFREQVQEWTQLFSG